MNIDKVIACTQSSMALRSTHWSVLGSCLPPSAAYMPSSGFCFCVLPLLDLYFLQCMSMIIQTWAVTWCIVQHACGVVIPAAEKAYCSVSPSLQVCLALTLVLCEHLQHFSCTYPAHSCTYPAHSCTHPAHDCKRFLSLYKVYSFSLNA